MYFRKENKNKNIIVKWSTRFVYHTFKIMTVSRREEKKTHAWIMNNCLRILTSENKYLSKLLITAKKKSNVEKQQKTKMCIGLEQCCTFVYVFDVAIYRFGTVLYPCILYFVISPKKLAWVFSYFAWRICDHRNSVLSLYTVVYMGVQYRFGIVYPFGI